MTGIDENRRSLAHVDGVLIALVFGLSLFGIVAVCVAVCAVIVHHKCWVPVSVFCRIK